MKTETKKKPKIPFSRMTKAQQRVRIAKDVIEWIEAEKFRPTNGTYINNLQASARDLRRRDSEKLGERQARDVVRDAKKDYCQVCAIGAAFMCALDRADKLKMKDAGFSLGGLGGLYFDDDTMRDYLGRWFSKVQLMAIEHAFEQSAIGGLRPVTDEEMALSQAAIAFGQHARGDEVEKVVVSRVVLLAIMKNIVRGRGTFRPNNE
jgi:hypothetical protein